ncbi:MAG: dephospho-CoA kinase [Acidobacteria bacterium]|nr:dephospho-CoA kinase [Acidobacteriota bacterium]
MLKIGLTGGIATGKSYVVSVLRELGCEVIDADALAHEVIEPGRPAFDEIVGHFGKDVVGDDGKIDRVKLGAIVFADKAQREKLNSIVHPRVYEAQLKWFAELYARNPEAIAVVDAALMIETGSYKRFDKVVVVYCEPDLQRERLMLRNNLTLEQAQARISAQMPSDEKLKFADYSINTSFSFEETREKVVELYGQLSEFKASKVNIGEGER